MGADEPFIGARVLLVVAHPDDEVIGAGARLPGLRDRVKIVHATNGAPDNNSDYAAARRQELLRAVALAGISPSQCDELGLVDQHASFHLMELTQRVAAGIQSFRPEIVLTHPYEGGHPDHDACAFAVHAAAARHVQVWEFTSYHMGGGGGMETGKFLNEEPGQVQTQRLTREQQTLKRQMFDCFETQRQVLANFGVEVEQFRPAPRYDFTQPPHPGQLYYEQFDWGIQGTGWRQLAAEALQLHAAHKS